MTPTLTRRGFLRSTGAALLAAAAIPQLPRRALALGGTNIQIVDTGHGTNADFLRPIADNGVKTIFRYYAQENNIPGKNITSRERDMIFDHGMSICIVYQDKAYLPGRFTALSAREDANFCLARAAEIRQPEGSAIFFAVDNDSNSDDEVITYLRAVNRIVGRRYEIGCYGSGGHCTAALNAGVVTMTWVAEAPAWGGTRQFMNSGLWHLYQNKTQIEDSPIMSAGGIPIDTNVLNPRYNSIGAFDRYGNRVVYDPITLQINYDRRMFVSATQLNVRDRPNGNVIAHMCVARTVHVLDVSDGWAMIDTNEDGLADGFCSMSHLRPLHQMPAYVSGCQPLSV
jgi:hypothetical protein